MTERNIFKAARGLDGSSTPENNFVASEPRIPTLVIPSQPPSIGKDPPPRESVTMLRGVTTTTMIIVGCVITSCVLFAILAAILLRHKKSRAKPCERKGETEQQPDETIADNDIYSEIESQRVCCFCLCRRHAYSVSSREHIDNIYAEVCDVIPSCPEQISIGKDILYETLDGKDWTRSRSKSQGANDTPWCNMRPKIYDHLSFQELERIQRENEVPNTDKRKVSRSDPVQVSATYDRLDRRPTNISANERLDDPDGNNNSHIRRLSQEKILKKLLVVECQKSRVNKRHDYFEIESIRENKNCSIYSVNRNLDMDSSLYGHRYFQLEDVREHVLKKHHQKPPVPVRTCSLSSDPRSERCVSYPCRRVRSDTGRRVRSFPESERREDCDALITAHSISVISSAVSSEGVYNIKTRQAARLCGSGRDTSPEYAQRSHRNDYFEVDPIFVNSDSTLDITSSSPDGQLSDEKDTTFDDCMTATDNPQVDTKSSSRNNDYFVLESEERDFFPIPNRFRIAEEDVCSTISYRQFTRQISEPCQRSSGGVTVIKLFQTGSDDGSRDYSDDSVYDRLRFQSVSEMKTSNFRPRLMSTPNHIDL